jgi:hypothetical protein
MNLHLKKATSYGTTGQKRLILYFINSAKQPNFFLSFKMILLHKTLLPEIKEAKFLFLVFIKGETLRIPHFTTYNY